MRGMRRRRGKGTMTERGGGEEEAEMEEGGGERKER